MTEETSQDIHVAFPDGEDLRLRFSVGACKLQISPGEEQAWIIGSYRDPTGRLPVQVIQEEQRVRISQGKDWADFLGVYEGVPKFDLRLGVKQPYALTFEGGASENILDLGGLPITRMTFKHGAGRNEIDFSAPNPQPMERLEIGAGAGSLELIHLANANASQVRIEGGAASFTCDFRGEMRSDMHVRISTGMASVVLKIPAATAAEVRSESMLGGLDIGDGFMKKEGAFMTEAALQGKEPLLRIDTSVALGSLMLRVV